MSKEIKLESNEKWLSHMSTWLEHNDFKTGNKRGPKFNRRNGPSETLRNKSIIYDRDQKMNFFLDIYDQMKVIQIENIQSKLDKVISKG